MGERRLRQTEREIGNERSMEGKEGGKSGLGETVGGGIGCRGGGIGAPLGLRQGCAVAVGAEGAGGEGRWRWRWRSAEGREAFNVAGAVAVAPRSVSLLLAGPLVGSSMVGVRRVGSGLQPSLGPGRPPGGTLSSAPAWRESGGVGSAFWM